MKPEVHCTSVASVVFVFIGVGKKTWPISHLRDRVDRQPSGRTTVAEVPYMEGFICKRKSYVDAGRVRDKICRFFA